jgi:tetratricopeptide (TPR) repeat protein
MADKDQQGQNGGQKPPERQPLSPATRKRLQKAFEHANKQTAQENYDYANELYTQCLVGDPSSLTYVQSFIANLQKKYKNNKKGSPLANFKERGARSAVKKALSAEQWDEVIKQGVQVLKVNPWDVSILLAMATAAEKTGDLEPQMVYLKTALEANYKDPDVNVVCAKALMDRFQFDQAIACLRRAEQVKPDDEEIRRLNSKCLVEKTIHAGNLDQDPDKIRAVRAGEEPQREQEDLTPEERAQRRIKQDPKNLTGYFELAQIYLNADRFDEAEKVFAKAYEVSGEDADVREQWEDVQLRRLRSQVVAARAKRQDGEEAEKVYRRTRKALNAKEIEVFQARCERYPNQMRFKFELGERYKLVKDYQEAIKQFQLARNDPRLKGLCLLRLGQCFQQIKQFSLAMSHFASAIEEIPDRDAENKKSALLLAGKMALYLKEVDTAEKYLTALASLDFGYKEVSELLDRIARTREGQL